MHEKLDLHCSFTGITSELYLEFVQQQYSSLFQKLNTYSLRQVFSMVSSLDLVDKSKWNWCFLPSLYGKKPSFDEAVNVSFLQSICHVQNCPGKDELHILTVPGKFNENSWILLFFISARSKQKTFICIKLKNTHQNSSLVLRV